MGSRWPEGRSSGHPTRLQGTERPHHPPRGLGPSLLSRGGRVGGGAWRAGAGPAAGAQLPGRGLRDLLGRGLGWDPAGAMELLSALSLGELALSFSRVPLFPVFDLSYFIVSILYLKYEPGAVELSRRHPLASWLCAMLHCFGSYILADLLLGEPLIDYFSNNSSVLLASAVWYLIFFCPLDLFYKCVCFLPVKLIFVAMKEVVRVRKIAVGIHHAHHHYHHGWFVMIATGWVKGSGVALMSKFEQLLRGVWKPETNEILHMSFPTKASLYGAILFTLQQTRWLPVSKASLTFIFTVFMVSCKVFLTATHSHGSPFDVLEGYICPVLFGAAWGDDHYHNNHGGSHGGSHGGGGPGSPHSALPAKSKEELSEGSRKKKTKKAD
ncbi:trimeric intracellular cation channel type A [Panthera uncia]|uniref:Trimeric intracellular cation channel type A n=3 Tax=Panthera TaxID=9688 RepID=A0A8C9CXW6_PANLE|nr:trimeric intracellular cation channel type A [Panthera uncia]